MVAVETRSNAAAGWTSVASAMSYQPFGAVESMALGNGLVVANDRGTDGRLRSRRLTNVSSASLPVGTKLSDLSYVYDPDGNVTSIDDKVMPERSAIYGYDAAGRLNMMVAEGSAASATYAYTSGTNKLASITTAAGGGGTAGTRSIAYDARGNPLSEARPAGLAVSLAYDGHGRLTSYARSGEASLSHSYNGMDDRVATITTPAGGSADTRRFIYAPDGRVLGEYGSSASDVRAEFIWMAPEVAANDNSLFGGDDGVIGSEGGGYMPLAVAANDTLSGPQLLWVHGNHMGVPAVFTNASGAQVAVPASYSLPGFPGQSRTFADLYYNRYRDYDPMTGRYIQADPIGLAGGASPYSYAMNSPLRYTDPTGEFVPLIIGAFLLGAGSDLAIQAGLNLRKGRRALDCINWTQVGFAGAFGAITGGVGGAGFRTAAGLSTKFSNVSRRIRRVEDLVGSGKDLHHWLIRRRFESAFGGRAACVVNGRWNLNVLAQRLHKDIHRKDYGWAKRIWHGSPDWAKWASGGGVVSIGGGIVGDIADGDCGCAR